MTSLEDRLTLAMDAAARTVPDGTAPALRLPGGERLPRLRPVLHRPARWLAPVASAAALLAVIGGLLTVAGHQPARPAAPQGGASVPPFYVGLAGGLSAADYAGIFSTSTGAMLAKVAAPRPDGTVIDVSAASDDRTFAIAAEPYPMPGTEPSLSDVSFFVLRFDPLTRAVRVLARASKLVPAGASYAAFALSADGRSLAAAYEPNKGHDSEILKIFTISTGMTRVWTSASGYFASDTSDPAKLSWTLSGKLAFSWLQTGKGRTLLPGSGLRLLNPSKPGTGVVADSRLAVPFTSRHGQWVTSAGYLSDIAAITPDGTTVVAAVSALHGPNVGFAEFSAATGHLERVLDFRPAGHFVSGGPTDALWAGPAGAPLVVYAPGGHSNLLGELSGDKLTLLPLPGKLNPRNAAAW